jgi:SRSO17 transposase
MIERALAAGVPFRWVAADSVYGVGDIERDLRQAGKGYVLGVNSNHWFASWGNPISSDQPSHMPRPLPHRTEPIPRLNQAAAVLYCVT